MRILTLLAAIVSLFLLYAIAAPAASLKQDQCLSPAVVKKQVLARTPDATIKRLIGPKAVLYLKTLNTIPPVSRLTEPDELFLIEQPAAPSSVFAIGFLNGCIIGNLQIRKTLHQKIMQLIAGKAV